MLARPVTVGAEALRSGQTRAGIKGTINPSRRSGKSQNVSCSTEQSKSQIEMIKNILKESKFIQNIPHPKQLLTQARTKVTNNKQGKIVAAVKKPQKVSARNTRQNMKSSTSREYHGLSRDSTKELIKSGSFVHNKSHQSNASNMVSLLKYREASESKVEKDSKPNHSNFITDRNLNRKISPRRTIGGQKTTKLQSLLDTLNTHKDNKSEKSQSRQADRSSKPVQLQMSMKSTQKMSDSLTKHSVITKYLKASKERMLEYRQKYLNGADRPTKLFKNWQSTSKLPDPKPVARSASSKSFANHVLQKGGQAADKFKSLQLASLGTFSQNPETKVKNTKSFVFADALKRMEDNQEAHTVEESRDEDCEYSPEDLYAQPDQVTLAECLPKRSKASLASAANQKYPKSDK